MLEPRYPLFPAREAGLVGGGGQGMGLVAQAQFDRAEESPVGGIDEFLGHVAEGLLAGRPQLVHQGPDAYFTVFGGRRRG
jgi:hypothetical protein